MICDECEDQHAALQCSDCGQLLCSTCDSSLHQKGKRRAHVRVSHSFSTGKDPGPTLAVYWDLSVLYPQSRTELQTILTTVTANQAAETRVYACQFLTLAKEMQELGLVQVTRQGLSVYESIIMDISLKMRTDQPSALVLLSTSEGLFRSFLRELAQTTPRITVVTGKGSVPVKLTTLDGRGWTPVSLPLQYSVICSSQAYKGLLTTLRTWAAQGQVQTPMSVVTTAAGMSEDLVLQAQEVGLVYVHFCPWDRAGERLVGLRATRPSVELLQWVFKSIREDRLTPSELYIKELVAMAFGYRPEASEWERLLQLPQYPLLITSGIDPLTCFPVRIIVPRGESWEAADCAEGNEATATPEVLQELINRVKDTKPGKELYGWIRHLQLCSPRESRTPSLGTIVSWVRDATCETRCPMPSLAETQLAVVDLLSASSEGLSLTSLPHFLTYKFCRTIHPSSFRLSKLSDLLEGIPEVSIERSGDEGTAWLSSHCSLTSTSDGEVYCFARSLTANVAGEGLEADKWSEGSDLLDYYEPHLKDHRHSYSRSADMRSTPCCNRRTIPSFGSVLEPETPSISSGRLETLSEEDSSSPQLEDKQSDPVPFEGLSS